MSKAEQKAYRAAIRIEWKKIVRRGRFTSYEYTLIDRWFAEGVETAVIIQAIKAALERAKRRSLAIYSIGFIVPDIERIKRDRARMNVGGSSASSASSAPSAVESDDDWRPRTAGMLEEIAESADPETRILLLELKGQLPELSRSEVERRYREIF
jgi:predicted secreted hydrolase